MSKRFCLALPTPATGFMDSFMLGNGRLGATVAGGVGSERIDINLDCLWSGGPGAKPDQPSPAHLLPELRRAIHLGDAGTADQLSRRMQGKGWTQSYQPLAGLLFRFGAEGAQQSYRRQLDMATATAEHHYVLDGQDVRVTSFVSTASNVAVTRVDGTGLLPFDKMDISWDCQHPGQSADWREAGIGFVSIAGRAPSEVIPPYIECDDPIRYGADTPGADGAVAAGMGFAAVAAIVPLPGGSAYVIAAAECGFRGPFTPPSADLDALIAAAQARVRVALGVPLDALHAKHVADHRHFFDRSDLVLPSQPTMGASDPSKAELLYHFGRYLLIASSRPGTEPANLQGIWNPYRRPAWSSNHTTNINAQMNYWPAQAAGLGDLAEPNRRMTAELVQAGRTSAMHYYGAPGAVTHHNTDLWRFTRPVQGDPNWANWTSALPWLLAQAWDHWEYGGADDGFARNQLLPMLAEVARFILFMLVEDGDGGLVMSPSSSPENCFLGPDGQPWGVARGAAMDQELSLEVLERLVTLSQRFGEQTELAAAARAALRHLRHPATDSAGMLQEWTDALPDAEPGHRHLSHLYGLYPGVRLHPAGGADVMPARRALEDRLSHGTGHTGWSQSWVLCLAARLGDASLCTDAIATLLTKLTTRALLVLHPYDVPEGAVFQIDGNFGATAGIGEMLLQSLRGTILLLPALPDHWTEGSFRGLKTCGGHTVDLGWQKGRIRDGHIVAGRDELLVIDMPKAMQQHHITIMDERGNRSTAQPTANGPDRCRIELQVRQAGTYQLQFS